MIKRKFISICVILINIMTLSAQNLVSSLGPNKKWGFINKEGAFVISPTFDEVQQEFTLGIACVKKDNRVFFINISGNAISEKFVWADVFSDNGLCKVNVGGKVDANGTVTGGSYGFIDISGAYVIKPVYEFVGSFNSYGLAIVNNGCKISEEGVPQGGKFGYIDSKGNVVVPVEYDFIGEFDDLGMCWVNKGGKLFEGDKTVDAQMGALAAREKNLKKLAAKREELENAVTGGKRDPFGRKAVGGLYGVYSKDGSVVIKVSYDKIADFHEGICRVQTKKGFGYVNANSAEIVPCTYLDAAPAFKEGRAWVKSLIKKESLYGFVNEKGEVVIDCIYRSVTDFEDNVSIVSKPGNVDKKGNVTSLVKYGMIDRDGNILTEPKYDLVSSRGDLLFCKLSGKYCFVTRQGKEVTPSVIIESKSFNAGQARIRISTSDAAALVKGEPLKASSNAAKDKGQWVVVNTDGIVVSDAYDKIGDLKEDFYSVEKNGLAGFINLKGETVIPMEYTKVYSFDNGFAAVMNSEMKWGFVDKNGKNVIACKYENTSHQLPEGIGIVMQDGKWGGLSPVTGEVLVPILLPTEADAVKVANTLYVEFGRKALSTRSIDIYNARMKGYKSRFSITDEITNEYWDY